MKLVKVAGKWVAFCRVNGTPCLAESESFSEAWNECFRLAFLARDAK